jgi:hypothetical protein
VKLEKTGKINLRAIKFPTLFPSREEQKQQMEGRNMLTVLSGKSAFVSIERKELLYPAVHNISFDAITIYNASRVSNRKNGGPVVRDHVGLSGLATRQPATTTAMIGQFLVAGQSCFFMLLKRGWHVLVPLPLA